MVFVLYVSSSMQGVNITEGVKDEEMSEKVRTSLKHMPNCQIKALLISYTIGVDASTIDTNG